MNWPLASLAVLSPALLAGFLWYERSRPPARMLALVAGLAALAVLGRIAFAPIPNVKPTTDIVLFSGYALGAGPGFAVGAVAALVSNFFFVQGPWTAWQMAAWGGLGAGAGGLARLLGGRELGRLALALVCAAGGLAFGAVMDGFVWTLAAEHTLASFVAVSGSSLYFNLAHVAGNVAFCLLFGPPFVRALHRYRRRFDVHWRSPQRGGTATSSGAAGMPSRTGSRTPLWCLSPAAALAFVLLAAPVAAEGASPASRAVGYLEGAQNRDGGFGGAPRQASNQLFTGWAGLGLAAAGRNPRDVKRGGRSLVDYIRASSGSLSDPGELERTILVLKASGLSPRRFAGRDLTGRLLSHRRPGGSFDGKVNLTAFGIMALRASGARPRSVRGSARWLADRQNSDGGFGFVAGAPSDVDDTGAALEALAAAGRRRGDTARRAVAYLVRSQHADGGFGMSGRASSNAQSTAWAVQGLVAAGRDPERLRRGGRTPLGYLRSLQERDGSIRYSRGSAQTPVWVTAQALAALRKKPFPLAAVRRRGGPGREAGGRGRRAALASARPEAVAASGARKEAGSSGAATSETRPDPSSLASVAVPRDAAEHRHAGRRTERSGPRRPGGARPARGRVRARRRRALPTWLAGPGEEDD